MGLKQTTARHIAFVRCWIETTPHHKAYAEYAKGAVEGRDPPTHMVLENYHERLRVPVELWAACYVIPAQSEFDNRMYRWDFKRELRVLRGKSGQTPVVAKTQQETNDVA